MNNLKFIFFMTLFCISAISISASRKPDILKKINLYSNEEKNIYYSDLFYSESYSLSFVNNPHISVIKNTQEKIITLKVKDNFQGLTTIKFYNGNTEFDLPVLILSKTKVSFIFKPDKDYKQITLFGSFNNWDRKSNPLTDPNKDGIYETEVYLDPGRYEYKFYADGSELVDPLNSRSQSNGLGSYNSILIVEDSGSKIFLHTDDITKKEKTTAYKFIIDPIDEKCKADNVIALFDNQRINSKNINYNASQIEITIDNELLKGEHLLRVGVNLGNLTSNIQEILLIDGSQPTTPNENFTWYDSIIYSLMIDRFSDGDKSINNPIKHDSLSLKANYFGGDFQGIINKLNSGYFDSLGVNTLWLSPVYDNPDSAFREYPEPHRYYSGYHGYWPIHHQKTEEKFGTLQLFKELVNIAHNHNMKVLLDFVSHHVHKDHIFYKNHPEWFGKLELPDGRLNLRFWDEFRLTTWFEPYLPSFDFLNSKEAVDSMTANAVWWLTETGADGFRHDAVKHVPNEFWRVLTAKINKDYETKTGKKVYQIGETFGDYDLVSSYVNNGQLDAQFNFNLYNTAQSVFINPKISFKDLEKEIKKNEMIYGSIHLMGNIMDSHDKNRFITYADGDLDLSQWSAIEEGWNNPPQVDNPSSYDKTELYLAYMNTISGLPVIYYGSEFGMSGASDPDNRRQMRFDDDLNVYEKNMLKDVRKIIKLRGTHSALRYGDFYPIQADTSIFSYIRSDFNERILIVLNKNELTQTVKIKIPEFYHVNSLTNLLDNETIKYSGTEFEINLAGYNYKIFKLETGN